MTDKLPRPRGGDGTGPDETPTERLLREAMNARTARITAHDLRPATPPNRRTRRLRPVYVTAVPLFGLAAALAFGVLGFRGDTVARQDEVPPPAATLTAGPSPSPSAEPTTEPSPTATPVETPSATETVTGDVGTEAPLGAPAPSGTASTAPPAPSNYTFHGVKFKVPAGWRVVPPDPADRRLCVLSPGAPKSATARDCAPYGVQLAVFDEEPQTWPAMSFLYSPDGWTSQPYCPVWGNPHVPTEGEPMTSGNPVQTRDIVAGRAARKSQWQVTCNAKESFTAQMWALPDDQVFLSAIGLKPEYQTALVSILDTLDVGGHPVPALRPNQNDVSIGFEGLGVGQQVPNDGSAVTFSVTYRNTSRTGYSALVPVVAAESYAGASPVVSGTLERQDGDTWTAMDLRSTDKPARDGNGAFTLAPGQSRTVKYRLKLTGQDGAGVMPVTARVAVVPLEGPAIVVGSRTVPVRVVAK
ncbi:hypothetical protein [Kitasatospora sp. NPDC088351]|uniref:hypothetical protein n=1 Tax=Kitasatospora sp. NPDC088351 TaxID=3155180 RepID=UPI0034275558